MVKLVSITPDTERTIGYCARVSNPKNQDNPDVSKLIEYCIKNDHWSILEQGFITFEVETSRGISPQILRHKSLYFQEFSLRYAEATEYVEYPARRQDSKNRQNSIDDLDEDTKIWFRNAQEDIFNHAHTLYEQALKKGIAKEQARFLLPLNTKTKLYISGTIRDMVHYVRVRTDPSTQLEHREIALEIKAIMIKELPTISKALGWI